MNVTIETIGETATMATAAALGPLLREGDVLALVGELGAGKTCFVRGLARGMGLDPASVSSPTFVLCQVYEGQTAARLAHVDAYRLGEPAELETIGWDELLTMPGTVVAVEWADRVRDALPPHRIEVDIRHVDERTRRIVISAPDDDAGRLAPLRIAAASEDHRCPSCDGPADPAAETFPFCSPRCRMADLGKWFSGSYSIGRDLP